MFKILKNLLIPTMLFTSMVFAQSVDGPEINLKTNISYAEVNQQVKITVSLSEPVVRFGLESISVDGGNVQSVRKLTPTTYLVFVRANNSSNLNVQVEANKVQSKSTKAFNEYASNEISISVNTPAQNPTQSQTDSSDALSKLMNQVQQQNAQLQTLQQQQSTQNNSNYVNCYGTMIPASQTCTNPNMINPYSYQNTQPVYDPYTGTYYYPQQYVNTTPTTYYPYTTGYSPYTTNSYYNYNTGLTPYSPYSSYSTPYTTPYSNTYNSSYTNGYGSTNPISNLFNNINRWNSVEDPARVGY